MDDPQGRTIGRFEILRKIGAGGMGEVYAARDPQLKRDVALKRLPPAAVSDAEWRDRLLREARSAARITHQHVAALHDVVEDGAELFLVMELVDGQTLRDLQLPLDNEEFLDVAKQCAAGVAAAHRQSIVHGDLKPDNIMLNRDGEVKVLDFGVAGMLLPAGGDATTAFDTLAVAPGSAGHTLAYAAPEILRGHAADARADLFSLGVVFYELLAGDHPFAARTATAMAGRVLHEDPVDLDVANPTVNAELVRIVHKLLAKQPRDRYATADDLLVDLRGALTRHATGRAMARRARPGVAGLPFGWRGVAAALGVAALLTAPGWSGYLPWGDTSAAVDRFDPSGWILAVLPAEYGEQERDLHMLNDGLATTLTAGLTRLSQSHEMEVVPASILRELDEMTPESARREYGVTLALTFDTQRLGDLVRVNANLIDIAARRQLAAETIDGQADDLLRLQEEVMRRVLRMLRLELRPLEQEWLRSGTSEPRAYGYYVRGRGYLENPTTPTYLDSAVELFEQALRVDPDYPAAHAGLGESLWLRYESERDPRWIQEAREACERATKLDATDAGGHVCLGHLDLGTGAYESAVAEFERATEIDPTRDDALVGLGRAYSQLEQPDRAEGAYRDAIALRPHFWRGYQDLGYFYYQWGRYDDAVANFEELVQLAPDSYKGLSDLGAAYYQVERWTDSRAAFERALQLNPEHAPSLSNLGTLLFYERDYHRAVELYQRAIEQRPRYYLYQGNLGDALYFLEGRTARAAQALTRARDLVMDELEVNSSDAWALTDLAWYQALMGETEATATFDQALALAPGDPEVLKIGAKIASVLQDDDGALDLLEQTIAAGTAPRVILREPAFERLRADPRLRLLLGSESRRE